MNKVFFTCLSVLLLTSCIDSSEQVYTKSLSDGWNKKAEQKFDFEINHHQEPKNIIFVVRNNNTYPYSNLRLFVNFTNQKTKQKTTDTLNYVLARPNGEWLGKGFGEIKEILFQYKMNYQFPTDGKYQIGIIQAMRKDNLPGIEDIGIKIEKANIGDFKNGK